MRKKVTRKRKSKGRFKIWEAYKIGEKKSENCYRQKEIIDLRSEEKSKQTKKKINRKN